jgi:amino acid permease
MSQTAEQYQSLWLLTASPVIWAAHFMLCYITASIWCVKGVGPGGSLEGIRMAIAVYTAVALVAIGIIGWIGYRRHSYGHADLPHDDDTPEDRHRFLGFATLLLSALSAVAVIYAALAAVFIGSCH